MSLKKTKTMLVDFGNKPNAISILVEVVEDYRQNWKCNTEAVYKKGQSRLYMRKTVLQCTQMLHFFYKSVVESAVCFAAIC